MSNQNWKFVTGLVAYLVLVVLIYWLVSLQLLIPSSINLWLSQCKYPLLAIWLFGFEISCVLWLLVWLGVKFPLVKPFIESKDSTENTFEQRRVWQHLLGLPYQFVFMIGITVGIGLWLIRPACEPPVIAFIVQSGDQKSEIVPNTTISMNPGSSLVISAYAPDNVVLSCQWSYASGIIQNMTSRSSCTTMVNFSHDLGNAINTLTASKRFCSYTNVVPIEITVKE